MKAFHYCILPLAVAVCFVACDFQIGVSNWVFIYKAKADYSNQIFISVDSSRTYIYRRPKKNEIKEYLKHIKLQDNYFKVEGAWNHNGWYGLSHCDCVPISLTIEQVDSLDSLTDEELLKLVIDFEPYLEFYSTNRNKIISKLKDDNKCNKIIKEGKLSEYMDKHNACNTCQKSDTLEYK
ncbi:MAG: hypothetical protein IK117_03875 [Bacteroidales bacterium]|nr:hypothetical protein [Bacteroidales bacterium]